MRRIAFLLAWIAGASWADTTNLAQQMLSQSTASANQNGSGCNVGTNLESRGTPTINPYGNLQQQETQCQSGETMSQCMKRLYNLK